MKWLGASAVLACLVACSSTSTGPYRPTPEGERNPLRAQELCAEAADLIGSDPEAAERLLVEALTADLFYGPAHNNLGVIYLGRGELYEAAQEFEWARKLMPGHPDPRVNLALVLESAGQTREAMAAYEAALEVYPDYLPAIQGIASLWCRTGEQDARTLGYLEQIASRSGPGGWRTWALGWLAQEDRLGEY